MHQLQTIQHFFRQENSPLLGRGLSSILNDDENIILDQKKNKLFNEIEIDLIDVNPFQPRTNFNSIDVEIHREQLRYFKRNLLPSQNIEKSQVVF